VLFQADRRQSAQTLIRPTNPPAANSLRAN
jgi:hypothetical protein